MKGNKDRITHELLNVFTRMIESIKFIYGLVYVYVYVHVHAPEPVRVFSFHLFICFLLCSALCVEKEQKKFVRLIRVQLSKWYFSLV